MPVKVADGEAALGQRSRFVQQQMPDARQDLQDVGVADQNAARRRRADAGRDRQRGRQAQGAGAGDDQNGDGADQAVGGRVAEKQQGQARQQRTGR